MSDISTAMVERVAERFRALGDPTRLRIIMHLQRGESRVGALAEALGIAQASMSKHLERLRACGILQSRREGAQVWYAIRDASINDLCAVVCGAVQRWADEERSALLGPALAPLISRAPADQSL